MSVSGNTTNQTDPDGSLGDITTGDISMADRVSSRNFPPMDGTSSDSGSEYDYEDDSLHTSFSISVSVKPLDIDPNTSQQHLATTHPTGSLTPVNQPTTYFVPDMFDESGSHTSGVPGPVLSLTDDNKLDSRVLAASPRILPPQNLTPEFAPLAERFGGTIAEADFPKLSLPPSCEITDDANAVPVYTQHMTPEFRHQQRKFDLQEDPLNLSNDSLAETSKDATIKSASEVASPPLNKMVSKLNLKDRFKSFFYLASVLPVLFFFPTLVFLVFPVIALWASHEFISTVNKHMRVDYSTTQNPIIKSLNPGVLAKAFSCMIVLSTYFETNSELVLFVTYVCFLTLFCLYKSVEEDNMLAAQKKNDSIVEQSSQAFSFLPSPTSFGFVALHIFSFIWITFPMSIAMKLYISSSGLMAVLFAVAVVGVGENGGLFVGYACGKSVPFPSLSPKKTYEGYLAQIGTSVITSLIYSQCSGLLGSTFILRCFHAIVLGSLLGLFGIVGDLFESYFKRSLGLKDVANTLPGWGGLLDRVDGLLFAFPITYIYISLFSPESL